MSRRRVSRHGAQLSFYSAVKSHMTGWLLWEQAAGSVAASLAGAITTPRLRSCAVRRGVVEFIADRNWVMAFECLQRALVKRSEGLVSAL